MGLGNDATSTVKLAFRHTLDLRHMVAENGLFAAKLCHY
jgi:hypothetical protein